MFYEIFLIFCAFIPFQFALNPATGVDLAIIRVIVPIMFLGWVVFALKNNIPLLKKSRITYLLILFLLLAVFSLCFSHNLAWSLRKLFFLLSLAPIYFIAVSVFSEKAKQRKIIIALVCGAAAVALIGVIQFISQFFFGIDPVYSFLAKNSAPFFLGDSFSKAVLAYPSWLVNSGGITYMRAIAIFPDPHMFSYYLGMLAPWSIALWATTISHKKLFFLSSLLIITADIFTFTRGGYIALIVSALVILPLVSRAAAKKLIAGVLLLLCLFVLVPHNPVAGRFISSFDIQEGSNQARVSNWQQALGIISAHPFGVGIGMYSLAVDPSANYREPIYAHNLYLDIAGELGIFTAIIFITLLYFVFNSFWKRSGKNSFFVAGVASITVFGVHSLVESPLYSVHILPLFLIIIALGAAVENYE
jgi:O-antigen ligase